MEEAEKALVQIELEAPLTTTTKRRMGKNPDAPTKIALLDATERVLSQHGYGAVVARRVAGEAKVNQQIVYYYFENMEQLVVATFRRRVEEFLESLEKALEAKNPLRRLWSLLNGGSARLFAEFIAMANHSDLLRADLQHYSARSNELQTRALRLALGDIVDFEFCSPEVINYILISVTRNLAVERELGTTGVGGQVQAFAERCLSIVEPKPARTRSNEASPKA